MYICSWRNYKPFEMNKQLLQESAVSAYQNDFFSGILMLAKKLFMI